MGLREVFDSIAVSWDSFRNKPLSMVKSFVKGRTGFFLAAGCGSGRHVDFLVNEGLMTVGFDFSFEMVRIAKSKRRGDFLVADLRAMPFKNNVFDYSISVASIHHLRPDEALIALRELKRVTKNDSLISVWAHPELRGHQYVKWGDQERYYYFYEPVEFKELVSKVFSKIEEVIVDNNIVLIVS